MIGAAPTPPPPYELVLALQRIAATQGCPRYLRDPARAWLAAIEFNPR